MTKQATVTVIYDRDISPEGRQNSQARFTNAKSIVQEIEKSVKLNNDAFIDHYITVGESIQITVRAVKRERKANVIQRDIESQKAIEKAKAIILKRVKDTEHFVF